MANVKKIIEESLMALLAVGIIATVYGGYQTWLGDDFDNNTESTVNLVALYGGSATSLIALGAFIVVYILV